MANQSLPNSRSIPTVSIGDTFGSWTVIATADKVEGRLVAFTCRCVCGYEGVVAATYLRRGKSLKCQGCSQRLAANARKDHGESNSTVEYRAYRGAKSRCENPKRREFKHYGGRGIEFRFATFPDFLAEVGRRPSPKHSIDRIDVNGHYEPGNVRWASQTTQDFNKRTTRLLTVNGVEKPLGIWAKEVGISPKTIRSRKQYGWCDTCAVTVPAKPGRNQSEEAMCVHQEKSNV